MAKGILDTSTLLLLPRLTATELPEEPLITAITLAELSVGPLVAVSDTERAARQAHLQQAEADFEPIPFDATAARHFGQVAAALRRMGRKPAARSYDAMIAAIALANDLPVHTSNPSDFEGIDRLVVVEVPIPDLRSGVDDDQRLTMSELSLRRGTSRDHRLHRAALRPCRASIGPCRRLRPP